MTLFVRGLDRFGNLPGDRQRLIERNRALRNAIRERRAFDELHHQSGHGVGAFEAVNVRDVRMIQRGENFGFALEAGEPLDIRRQGLRQHLDRDGALQVRVRCAVDLAQPAHADPRGHFIRAETGAWSQGQTLWIIRSADRGDGITPASRRRVHLAAGLTSDSSSMRRSGV